MKKIDRSCIYGGWLSTGKPGVRDVRGAQANPHSVRESAYDAFCETSPKTLKTKRNTMIALREQSRGVLSSFMFCQGVCRCLYQTW